MRPSPTAAETRRLGGYVVAVPFAMVALVAGPMAVRGCQDSRSDPYIRATVFHALPGCPTRAEAQTWIPRRCVDPRYHIRQQPERYRLARDMSKRRVGWLRVGPDAARIRDCIGDQCRVVEVVRGAFPRR